MPLRLQPRQALAEPDDALAHRDLHSFPTLRSSDLDDFMLQQAVAELKGQPVKRSKSVLEAAAAVPDKAAKSPAAKESSAPAKLPKGKAAPASEFFQAEDGIRDC